jgi:hypothetical protein
MSPSSDVRRRIVLRVSETVRFGSVDDDFFPVPPSPREPEPRPPSPPWMGPPYGVLPGAVALEVVLAQNEQAVCLLSANGRRRASRWLASRSIPSHSGMPPAAHASCSQTRPQGLGTPPGHEGWAAREPAPHRTGTRSLSRGRREASASTETGKRRRTQNAGAVATAFADPAGRRPSASARRSQRSTIATAAPTDLDVADGAKEVITIVAKLRGEPSWTRERVASPGMFRRADARSGELPRSSAVGGRWKTPASS